LCRRSCRRLAGWLAGLFFHQRKNDPSDFGFQTLENSPQKERVIETHITKSHRCCHFILIVSFSFLTSQKNRQYKTWWTQQQHQQHQQHVPVLDVVVVVVVVVVINNIVSIWYH
jgi:uncharacterized membrane protein YidH (DUF202 family)